MNKMVTHITAAMPLRQPVTARSFKTREGGITEKQIDQSDEISEKAQEFASDLKVLFLLIPP